MNRFSIEESFAVEPDVFLFAGTVLEGRAGPGMKFEVPEAGHQLQFVVRSVERELVGLTMKNSPPGYLPGLGIGWTAELREA